MYGNKDLKILSHNFLKTLLLSHSNTIISLYPTEKPSSERLSAYLTRIKGRVNKEQMSAVKASLTPAITYRDYVSLVTGPSGTRKGSVSVFVVLSHRPINACSLFAALIMD
jgi:hypothetical protein